MRRSLFLSCASAETIYGLSTVPGRSGLAVVRVSGPQALEIRSRLAPSLTSSVQPRKLCLATIHDPSSGEILDKGMVASFLKPKSFTGEDMTEFHIHGSLAVTTSLLRALGKIRGTRMAEPGEFSKRAFFNGKMDLTEVEGLGDLLNASTDAQRRLALNQMEGGLRAKYENWRDALMKCLAHVEAVIDFGEDEDDCNDEVYDKAGERIANLVKEIKEHLDDGRRGELIRDGLRVALIGPPNAGKSSLLNILARRPAAIVSSIPGTTRDVIEVHMDIAGYPVHVNDTAGLRDTADIIEQEGVKRATEVAGKSQVKVLVVDAEGAYSAFKDRHLESALPNSMLVLNKADKLVDVPAPGPLSIQDICRITGHSGDTFSAISRAFLLSCETRQGVSDFLSGLEEEIRTRYGAMDAESNSTLITRERHRQHVEECLRCLEGFLAQPATVDLAAEELRRAMTSLGRITGRVDVEDLLDIIFTDFCIGK